jgi:hypothetical protein
MQKFQHITFAQPRLPHTISSLTGSYCKGNWICVTLQAGVQFLKHKSMLNLSLRWVIVFWFPEPQPSAI